MNNVKKKTATDDRVPVEAPQMVLQLGYELSRLLRGGGEGHFYYF